MEDLHVCQGYCYKISVKDLHVKVVSVTINERLICQGFFNKISMKDLNVKVIVM